MNYLDEWKQSGVDSELVELNVIALEGTEPYDYLCYSDKLPRRNDGRLISGMLRRYAHVESGGWWCSGTNLLTGTDDLWGCFKPDLPRLSRDRNKPIKYEHPPKIDTGIFALRVPMPVWQRIAERAGLTFDPNWIDKKRRDLGFWSWLLATPSVPVCITEGAKKAGALLSAGYAAIGLPGINNGYRTPRDDNGYRTGKSRPIPQVAALAGNQRPIYIAFDRDEKPKTVRAVNGAIRRLGYLLTQADSPVRVVSWSPEQGKGVDDFIVAQGVDAFERAFDDALSLDTWKASLLSQLTYPCDLDLEARYLPTDLDIPDTARIVAIQSPKGTGKTEAIGQWVRQAIARDRRVLVVGHRVQLVEALCRRFGLPYVTQVDDLRRVGSGYGLCIDSLHGNSQAKFCAEDWRDAIVIFDEVEQVFWHALNSDTCRNRRVDILETLKQLMQLTIGESGRVYAADADLSDTSLDYLCALSGVETAPFIVRNRWQPETPWEISHYTETTPKRLFRELEAHIADGGRPFVCLSAQKLKSKWSTTTIAAYLQEKFPDRKLLRIDSESVNDVSHPAYGCTRDLDRHLPNYDIVLASPSIETGISIDLRGHFTSVWAIAQGIQSENSVRQSLSRLRDGVPRHLWAAPYGFNKIGNGSTSVPSLLNSGQKLTQFNIRLLQQSDFSGFEDFDAGFQAESLQCWAKFATRVNATMASYREAIAAALTAEGHNVTPAKRTKRSKAKRDEKTSVTTDLIATIANVRERNYLERCREISSARDLNHRQYRALRQALVKSQADRHTLRKYELKRRYGVPVTIDLIRKDDDKWYDKLRRHYFLTDGREYLAERDRRVARHILQQGSGRIFQPDFNRSQLGATIGILELLGLPTLLKQAGRELRNSDTDLQDMCRLALQSRSEIKIATGIGLAKNSTPMVVLRRLLDAVGFPLTYLRCEGSRKQRMRVYRIDRPSDHRESVFRHWLSTDHRFPGWSESAPVTEVNPASIAPNTDNNGDEKFEQLCLGDLGQIGGIESTR